MSGQGGCEFDRVIENGSVSEMLTGGRFGWLAQHEATKVGYPFLGFEDWDNHATSLEASLEFSKGVIIARDVHKQGISTSARTLVGVWERQECVEACSHPISASR